MKIASIRTVASGKFKKGTNLYRIAGAVDDKEQNLFPVCVSHSDTKSHDKSVL